MPPITYLRLAAIPPTEFSAVRLNLEKRVAYSLVLENLSVIPAQLPFFCIMDLGLQLEAHHDWQLDKIVSEGRKLIRCAYRGNVSLMPSKQMAACSLILRLHLQDGAQVSFGNSALSDIETMKDLRLFAIAGAANFPAQRGQLLVTANEVQRGLRTCFGHLSRPQEIAV